ncbi:MAG: class I SAM-dependent methyltransferase, partial [Rhodospirillales bacterium]|nr:class I SAM-dependent methyltransferase [Rhodospirillales bacterium]
MSAETSSIPCRLCGAPAHALFRQNVRDRIPVWFHECGACRSLQGEPGSWLEEGRARHSADIGRVRRSLDTAILIDVALQLLGGAASHICLDFGGGDGLFARMMRDRGYNFFCRDPLIANVYTPFHDAVAKPVRDVAVVTAFDVLDYCADPAAALEDLFAFEADLVMASAGTWQGQGPDWPGLGLEEGRRGFFYSPEALDTLAGRHGYHLLTDGRLHVFCRPRPTRLSYDSAQIRRLTAQLAWGDLEKLALKHFCDRLRQPYCFVQEDYRGILRGLRAAH